MAISASAAPLRALGLTGGVGAGKSSFARLLAHELHGLLLDADDLVAALFKQEEVLQALEKEFGPGLLTASGTLDRSALAAKAFAKESVRRRLEALLHPLVRRELVARMQIQAQKAPGSWVILDIPLLREGGLDQLCQFIIHVATPPEERCQRACQRHGWSAEEWHLREAAQMPEAEKRALADFLIDNSAAATGAAKQASLPRELAQALDGVPAIDLGPALARMASMNA